MRFLFSGLLAATALFSGAAAGARSDRSAQAEERIAKAVSGRVAGKPVDCLELRDIRSTRIIDGAAILYETNDRTIYVNRPAYPGFLRDSIMVTDTHSPRLCSIDIVRLVDRGSRMSMGSIGLGPFVPYPKVRQER